MVSCNSTSIIFNFGQAAILIGSQRDFFSAVAHRLAETSKGATAMEMLNKTFGRWTVIRRAPSRRNRDYWLCRCVCGKEREVNGSDLRFERSLSCGCLRSEQLATRNFRHGLRFNPTYNLWNHIKQRCHNPRVRYYYRYGGRGIRICSRWLNFEEFLQDMGECPEGLTIDRKNNDGHYSCGKCKECLANGWPMNVRWATPKEQARNTKSNVLITFEGRTQCVTDWATETGLIPSTIAYRLKRGFSTEQVLFPGKYQPKRGQRGIARTEQ